MPTTISAESAQDLRFWDRIAPKYAQRPVPDAAAYAHTLERVRSYLKADHKVLELGCGTGTTAVHLARNVAQFLATDLSPAMIDIGRSRAAEAGVDNLAFTACTVSTAPKGPFDVILGFNLLHLLPDLDAALADVAARLQPGGMFLSKTACLAEGAGLGMQLMLAAGLPVMQRLGRAPAVVQKFHVAELEQKVEAAGFEILETGSFPARPPNRFLVARRL